MSFAGAASGHSTAASSAAAPRHIVSDRGTLVFGKWLFRALLSFKQVSSATLSSAGRVAPHTFPFSNKERTCTGRHADITPTTYRRTGEREVLDLMDMITRSGQTTTH